MTLSKTQRDKKFGKNFISLGLSLKKEQDGSIWVFNSLTFDVFKFCPLISSLEYKNERKIISHLGILFVIISSIF